MSVLEGAPDGGLNFIVGGIPRSGTTAFGNMLNFHPEVFCYASESNLIPTVQKVGSNGSVPPPSMPRARNWLRKELRQSLIDMVNHQISAGSPKPAVRFTNLEIDQLVEDVFKGIDGRINGVMLLARASQALAGELRRKSNKGFVGEKTPSNVLALDALEDGLGDFVDPAKILLVVRRPFAVIASMRARLSDKADVFTSSFEGDVAQQAGYYLRYAFACMRLARRGAQVFRYESFAGNARAILPKVLSTIGVSAHSRCIETINQHIEIRHRGDYRKRFTLAEQAAIDCITEAALVPLGYGRDPRSRSSEAVFPVGYRVLAGGHQDKMLAKRTTVLLVAEQQHRRAKFRLWHKFPGTVADSSDTVSWIITDSDGRRLGMSSAVGGGPSTVDVSITLDPIRGTKCANGHFAYVVEVCCSHAFVPLIHPFRTLSDSGDVREVSGQILSVDFA